MQEKKKVVTVDVTNETAEKKFNKQQILASEKYKNRRDLVEALLEEDKNYTIEKVEELINKFMKGQVK